jgi:3-oxoacyl-[acyl-carrier protein] reductase
MTSAIGTVLVAGANGAIGQEVVRCATVGGWQVLAIGRRAPPQDFPAGVTWIKYRPDQPAALLSALSTAGPLRGIVFCIGAPSSKQVIAATPAEEWSRLYHDNVISLAQLWAAVAPWARSNGTGLVALSSDATATMRAGNGPYTAAKAALEALVVTLAKEEAAFGVRANVLAPSLVRSPMGEEVLRRKGQTDAEAYYETLAWGRPISVEEVAQVALDIAVSLQWRYASGQVFRMAVRENA